MSEKWYRLDGTWDHAEVSGDLRSVRTVGHDNNSTIRRCDGGWQMEIGTGSDVWTDAMQLDPDNLGCQLDRATARIARETGWIPLTNGAMSASADLQIFNTTHGQYSLGKDRTSLQWLVACVPPTEDISAELDRIAAQVKRPAFVEEYNRLGIDSSHNQKFTVTSGTRIASSGSVGVSSAYLFAKYDPVAGYTLASFDDETDEPTQVRKRPLERPCEGCEEKEAAPKRLYCSVECWREDAAEGYASGGNGTESQYAIARCAPPWTKGDLEFVAMSKIQPVPDAKPVRLQIAVDDPEWTP